LRGNFGVYNVFNANTILRSNTWFGAAWLQPTEILLGRLITFSARLDF